MRRMILLAGLVVSIGLALGAPQAGAIIDGTYDDNDHPNVGILYFNDLPAFTTGFCSGSLLSAHEFLTAGHCTAALSALGVQPSQMYVSFDPDVSISPEGVISTAHPIAVTGWETHPAYKGPPALAAPTIANDVGVIHLASDVALTPIHIPAVGFLDTQAAKGGLRGHVFTDIGYGLNGGDRPYFTPGATFTWNQQREALLTPFKALTPEHLQTHGGLGGGDSGGPVFFGGADPELVVATAVDSDELGRALIVDQRLDTKPVHDFLEPFTY